MKSAKPIQHAHIGGKQDSSQSFALSDISVDNVKRNLREPQTIAYSVTSPASSEDAGDAAKTAKRSAKVEGRTFCC